MQGFLQWIFNNGSYFLLFSTAIAIIKRNYLVNYLRFVTLFIAMALLGEFVAYVTSSILAMPNLFILHIYTVLEFNIIALFYLRFFEGFYSRLLMPSLMVGFTLFAIANSFFLQPFTESNTYARAIESLLIIGLSLMCFNKVLTELPAKRLDKHPVFWINTGFLLYFAGSLFFFILSNALLKQPNQQLSFMAWGLHALLMALMHVFIGIGLWFSPNLR